MSVTVVAGHADALPAPDGSFDAAVASLVLCSVPDQSSALAELARVLRPGGQLRFYEHVRSGRPVVGRAEDLIAPVWSRLAGGCHPNRDTAAAIRAAGFVIDDVERVPFGLSHLLGPAHTRAHDAGPTGGALGVPLAGRVPVEVLGISTCMDRAVPAVYKGGVRAIGPFLGGHSTLSDLPSFTGLLRSWGDLGAGRADRDPGRLRP